MRTLFLHIGFHKTGSSSLQLSLFNSQEKLKLYDWEFFSLDLLGNSSSFVSVQQKNKRMEYSINAGFFESIKSTSSSNVVISGEHFSFINRFEELTALKEKVLESFDKIKIITYLRRQDKLALSFKQQASKGYKANMMPSSKLCGHSKSALPELTEDVKDYLDFNKKINLWQSVFGSDANIIRIFEPSKLINGDICADFSQVVNLPFPLQSYRVNEGVTRLSSLCSHFLLEHKANPALIQKVQREVAQKDSKVLPAISEALSFYEYFRADNDALAEALGEDELFSQDFSCYPIKSDYFLSEDEKQMLLEKMANFSAADANVAIKESEIDSIRDAALLIEKYDVEKALSLMLLAKKLRPHGKLINQKVTEYNKAFKI